MLITDFSLSAFISLILFLAWLGAGIVTFILSYRYFRRASKRVTRHQHRLRLRGKKHLAKKGTQPLVTSTLLVAVAPPEQGEGLAEIRMFTASKEEDAQYAEDKQACHREGTVYRCAITDGVSTSFLASQWAKIIASRFVQQEVDLSNATLCIEWLHDCSTEWHTWVEQTWIPTIEQQQGRKKDWSYQVERGAQTTLNGCSFSVEPLQRGDTTQVQVTAIGDANFFLVRSPSSNYQHYSAFPCKTREEFGPTPETLGTTEESLHRCWRYVQQEQFTAAPGDSMFLATDALARWIFLQLQQEQNPWLQLLALADDATFRAFIHQERENAALEMDDTTLTVICLAPGSSQVR